MDKKKNADEHLPRASPRKQREPSVVDGANFFSRLYCFYAAPFLFHILNHKVDLNYLSECAEQDKCALLSDALEKNWNIELEKPKSGKKPSFVRALLKTFSFTFFLGCIPNFLVYGVGKLFAPVALGKIIKYANIFAEMRLKEHSSEVGNKSVAVFTTLMNTSDSSIFETFEDAAQNARIDCIIWSAVLLSLIVSVFFVSHPYWMYRFRNGMQIRVAITGLIYRKALKTSLTSIQKVGVGKIVNLIANDANRFEVVVLYCEFVFLSILELAVAMIILYVYIGPACFGCLAILLIYAPFQCYMANILSRFRSKSIMLTDERLKLMSEILPAMQVIKMYVWEKPFAALVHLARKLEMSKIRQAMILRSINLSLYFASPKVMAFVSIILFLIGGGKLNAEIVFVTLSIVFQVRDTVTYFMPNGISYSVEAYISSKRIESFLLEDEVEKTQHYLNDVEEPKIELKNVTVYADKTPILEDINFDVSPGKLTVIIGPVGAGKSSILLSILKEMPLKSGSITTQGNIIYASQESWIFNGTVRDNILFGRKYESERYKEVIRVAALSKDIAGFDDGDLEKVDDRGTSLSGGQKARISLARALYAEADVYLLDDPLSAVDASVAKHIFEKCIKKHLANKCVVLVTHQLQFIKSADQIVVLKDGATLAVGSYTELLAKGIDVFKYSVQEQTNPLPPEAETRPRFVSHSDSMSEFYSSRRTSFRTDSFHASDIDSTFDQLSMFDKNAGFDDPTDEYSPQNNAETQYSGPKMSRGQLYWIYVRSGGGFILFFLFLSSNILTQLLFTGSDYWLSLWTDYQEKVRMAETNSTVELPSLLSDSESSNKLIYSSLVLVLFLASIVRTVSYFVICTRSSVKLHNSIFSSLIEAPMVFFDKTPIGVIMNRVSRDLGIIDDLIPPTMFEAIDILTNSLGIFIICAAVNQYVLIPFVFLVVMCYFANKFYVGSARKIKKLEALARSPIFNQMSSTISGLATIRAYHAERMLVDNLSEIQNVHTSTLYMFYSCSRIYGEFLELLCIVYLVCLVFILNYFLEDYPASVIGLTISQSLMLTNAFNWGIRQYTEVETQMTSVERVVEFGNLEKESLEQCSIMPVEEWPQHGDINFEDVSLEYSYIDDETGLTEYRTVLDNLTFSVQGGEKIGIVGRTGAGKSSLIAALFRLTTPSGVIEIDGHDCGEVALTRLRASLSIIPQEPILFSGTIRRNLDPFGDNSDEQLWDALTKVQLKNKVQQLSGALDSVVSECGGDFSVGQKQLICLARAILRRNRILVLDEATANVDPRTDALIQSSIRTEFAHCTVLTIAHRLNTVIDYDRILVLDSGHISQYDTPYALIKAESGIFYELYSNLNNEMRRELKKIAYSAEEARRQKLHNLQDETLSS